ncbi:MAG: hypothetical protein HWE33_06830 [Rhodobacteraceae bacterium]|nr:hypothetical protein [Paracoccaceae bacterium]
MDISEIKDRDTLEAWLQGRSREDAVAIAARAALRVLPVYWQWSLTERAREVGLTALPVLRSALTTCVAAVSATPEIKTVAAAATISTAVVTNRVADAVTAIADAAKAATNIRVADAAAAAADAATAATYASSPATGIPVFTAAAHGAAWRSILADCNGLEKGEDIFSLPLWRAGNHLEQVWRDVEVALARPENAPETWQFWRDWYAAMLDPIANPPNWKLYEQVALIGDDVWKDGPEAVAERLSDIEERGFPILDLQRELGDKAMRLALQVERLQDVVPALSDDLLELRERFGKVEVQANSIDQNYSKASKTAESLLTHTANAIAQSKTTVDQRFGELLQEYEAKFQASLDAFHAANRIKAPVDLWSEKEKEHKSSRKIAFFGFVAGLIVIAAAIVWVGYTLLNPSENLVLALSPIGCEPVGHPELCKGFSFRGMILSGSVLTLLTLALWFTRIQMKQYLSERHLVLDARERRAFAQTYIGLIEEGDTSEDAQEQRALVYAALFRPSSDGIIKDEGGIDPSLTAALSKLLAGK